MSQITRKFPAGDRRKARVRKREAEREIEDITVSSPDFLLFVTVIIMSSETSPDHNGFQKNRTLQVL
ncbi:hypothetical protein BHM03_00045755 [Ensete ventricosum]|nr:hypothetical protein BHM03_00045755 [Ensete ventricosum]